MNSMTLISGRTDGLGERLNSVFNAIALSKLSNIDFKVAWPFSRLFSDVHHSVENIDCIFSTEFIEKNIAADTILVGKTYLYIPEVTIDLLHIHLKKCLKKNRSLIPQSRILNKIKLDSQEKINLIAQVNSELDFSEKIKRVREIISSIQLPENPTAIHLRAGDLIYGSYKENPRFTNKLITAPAASGLIEEIKAKGKKPILFGQEQFSIQKLSDRFEITNSNDLLKKYNFDRLESAFADIFLMSRCNEIYAGSSGFPRFAAQISNIPLRGLNQIKPSIEWSKTILTEIKSHPDCYTSEHIAFSLFSAYMLIRETSSFDTLNDLLQLCTHHNCSNIMFKIYLALNYYRFEYVISADTILEELVSDLNKNTEIKISNSRLIKILNIKSLGLIPESILSPYSESLIRASNCNSTYSSLLEFFATNSIEVKQEVFKKIKSGNSKYPDVLIKYLEKLVK